MTTKENLKQKSMKENYNKIVELNPKKQMILDQLVFSQYGIGRQREVFII